MPILFHSALHPSFTKLLFNWFICTCYYFITYVLAELPAVWWRTVPVHWSLQSTEVCVLSSAKRKERRRYRISQEHQ